MWSSGWRKTGASEGSRAYGGQSCGPGGWAKSTEVGSRCQEATWVWLSETLELWERCQCRRCCPGRGNRVCTRRHQGCWSGSSFSGRAWATKEQTRARIFWEGQHIESDVRWEPETDQSGWRCPIWTVLGKGQGEPGVLGGDLSSPSLRSMAKPNGPLGLLHPHHPRLLPAIHTSPLPLAALPYPTSIPITSSVFILHPDMYELMLGWRAGSQCVPIPRARLSPCAW